jgi:hypothetical protein
VNSRTNSGLVPEVAVKLGIDLSDELAFSAKVCGSCHGFELDHAMVEYMPSQKFNVQVGRLTIPFGEYSNRVDPSGHKTSSAPLIFDMGRMAFGERSAMNMGVVPLPYVDNGVLLYGQFFPVPRLQAWYGGYVVGGFRGSNDVDWISMRSAPYADNNRFPAVGGRVALTLAGEQGALLRDVSLGSSVTTGQYDKDAKLRYVAWGVNGLANVWRLTLRAEYAQRRTDLAPDAAYRFQLVDDYLRKDGGYVELEHPVYRWVSAVYRADLLRRTGEPLPGASATLSPDSRIQRYTAGLFLTPASSLFVKLNYEYWVARDFTNFGSVHAGVGGAF